MACTIIEQTVGSSAARNYILIGYVKHHGVPSSGDTIDYFPVYRYTEKGDIGSMVVSMGVGEKYDLLPIDCSYSSGWSVNQLVLVNEGCGGSDDLSPRVERRKRALPRETANARTVANRTSLVLFADTRDNVYPRDVWSVDKLLDELEPRITKARKYHAEQTSELDNSIRAPMRTGAFFGGEFGKHLIGCPLLTDDFPDGSLDRVLSEVLDLDAPGYLDRGGAKVFGEVAKGMRRTFSLPTTNATEPVVRGGIRLREEQG